MRFSNLYPLEVVLYRTDNTARLLKGADDDGALAARQRAAGEVRELLHVDVVVFIKQVLYVNADFPVIPFHAGAQVNDGKIRVFPERKIIPGNPKNWALVEASPL